MSQNNDYPHAHNNEETVQPNTPNEIEAIVEFIAETKLSRLETAMKVREMLTQLNASRMAEVVSIAEGMKQISVVVPHHNPYLSGYNQALNELITALT